MRQRGFEAVARLKETRGMRIFKRGFEKAVEMKEGQTQINLSFKKKGLPTTFFLPTVKNLD